MLKAIRRHAPVRPQAGPVLNTTFDGAETTFPLLGVNWRAETAGDAIAWSNVLRDGAPDRKTQHAGLPPTRGRKWVLSQRIRNRGQPMV
ncbi:MAG: hypothetical protein ABL871_16770 [Terricaulis sp.]